MRSARLATLLLAVAALTLCRPIEAAEISPLAGQGYPPDDLKELYLSVFLERLLAVDDNAYRFTAVLYFVISWVDRSAFLTVLKNAQSPGNNEIQDLSWLPPGVADMDTDAYAAYYNITLPTITGAGVSCAKFCGTAHSFDASSLFCCDFIYIPSFHFRNAFAIPQDREEREEISFSGPAPTGFVDNTTLPEVVTRWAFVHMEFYTPMDFKAYPFDQQRLAINLKFYDPSATTAASYIQVRLSAFGTKLYTSDTGDTISEWAVSGMTVAQSAVYSGENFDKAINQSLFDDVASVAVNKNAVPQGTFRPNYFYSLYNTFTPAQDVLIPITLIVTRFSFYHVLNDLVPVILTTLLGLIVFFIEPSDISNRSAIVVTLFLALTALQFVLGSSLPSSSYMLPTQYLTLMSYVTLLLLQACNMCTYYILNMRLKRSIRTAQSAYDTASTARRATIKQSDPGDPPAAETKGFGDALPVFGRPFWRARYLAPAQAPPGEASDDDAAIAASFQAPEPNGPPAGTGAADVEAGAGGPAGARSKARPPAGVRRAALALRGKLRRGGGKPTAAPPGRLRERLDRDSRTVAATTTMMVNGDRVTITRELRMALRADKAFLVIIGTGYLLGVVLIFTLSK